ncbi:AraC-like DNA-binding protein [Hallella colorans]|uniref:AraC-like DNA-binding protein n=2 Tax=Hallella colorans TaxID=1703337 RepID=A0A2U0ULK9_9BACT|nr:AraC-like DNA-binding protein [Hallella colorans]
MEQIAYFCAKDMKYDIMNEQIKSETNRLFSIGKNVALAQPDYLDDDLIIIDNVKLLSKPGTIRPNMNIIAICTRGRLQTVINGAPLEVCANQVCICPPETVLDEMMVTPDFEYVALCITNRALQVYLRQYINVWNDFAYVQKMKIIDLNQKEIDIYHKVYDLIGMCLRQDDEEYNSSFRKEMMKGLLSASLIGLCGLLKKQTGEHVESSKQNISLFNRFLQLLQTAEIKHQPVEYYASQLCISSKYLTMICKKNSHKTAKEWIQEYTLADIAYYLRNTSLSVKEVSNKTGFSNSSFFGKYVKDNLGYTPLQFRQKE